METILVVDDEKNYLLVLSAVLEEEGYEVLTTVSGLEALEIQKSSDLDLVLTDMKMPGMDGIELLERIKAHDPELPVIMMTAHGTVDKAVEAMQKEYGLAVYTGPFHQANAGKVVFSSTPILAGKETPAAMRSAFTCADDVYGMMYFKGTFTEVTRQNNTGVIELWVDGTKRADYNFRLDGDKRAQTWLTSEVIPDPATSTTRGAAIFTKAIAELSPRSHTIKISCKDDYNVPIADGEFTLDCSAGLERVAGIHRELEDNLASLSVQGLIFENGESFLLTQEGASVADAAYRRARESEDRFVAMAHSPAVATRFSLIVGVVLAVVKLVPGTLFHSAALVQETEAKGGLDRALAETGLGPLFHATRCADETFSKPHPEMLIQVMAELGADRSETLMIGDTEFDMEMARNAGVAALAVAYGVHHPERLLRHEPLDCLKEFQELREWLERNLEP